MRRRLQSLLFGALVAGFCLGCSASRLQPYPKTWPPVQRTERTCDALAGTYRDHGQFGDMPAPFFMSLTELLFGGHKEAWRPDRLTFSFPQSAELRVDILGSNGESVSRTLSLQEGHFICRAPTVVIQRPNRWSSAAAGAVGAGRLAVTLELDSIDGALVIRREARSFVVAGFVVPLTKRESRWYRFDRAQD